jgi:hypothetical protein
LALSLADSDKTLAAGDTWENRATTGSTVHRNFGRELGRSKALLWQPTDAAPEDSIGATAPREPAFEPICLSLAPRSKRRALGGEPFGSSQRIHRRRCAGPAADEPRERQVSAIASKALLLKHAACSVYGCALLLGIRRPKNSIPPESVAPPSRHAVDKRQSFGIPIAPATNQAK